MRKAVGKGKRYIVVVGSINMDLVAGVERIPFPGETVLGKEFHVHPGGKGANQAVAIARLGWPVKLIGRLGDDAFGHALRQQLQDAGVDASTVAISPGSSGVAVILVSDQGENCIVVTPGANALLTPADLDAHIDTLRTACLVLTQLEIPLATVSHLAAICAREGIPLMLDPAPAQMLPEGLLQKVTWFTPNDTEAAFYIGGPEGIRHDPQEIASELLRKGANGVVLKLGAHGAYVLSKQHSGIAVDPFAVEAVDTTAAGDAFNGAFATALQMGKTLADSARFAAAAAALSVTKAGAQPSMPTLQEVEKMLAVPRGVSESAP